MKSMALGPVIAVLVMFNAALPALFRLTANGELVVSTGSFPKVRLVGDRLTMGGTPVPMRLTVCGLPLELSVRLTAAARDPLAVGLNVTLIEHLAPAATLDPQPLVCAKSPGLAPVSAMLEMLKAAVPVFVSVTVWAALVEPTAWPAKARLLGDTLAMGAVPVPLRLTVCGLPLALSVNVTAAERVPLAVGLNVTLIEHLAPAATLDPQPLVWAKSPELAPVSAMLEMLNAAVPELVNVSV
jgi:hypothetical protein